ncbi:MAG: hypothetical protein M1814_002474 [Vezdaea aestivalis]|nr:MAG: hypothetical protein M1814_002474 [Vezdaea aestivalis]
MFTQANPGAGKSDEDKAAIAARYSPGDEVLPKVSRREATSEEEEERRQLEQVMGLSLQEVGIGDRSARLEVPGSTNRPSSRERSRDRRSRSRGTSEQTQGSTGRERTQHRGTVATTWSPPLSNRHQASPSLQTTVRQLEHQSSLRSLLSASDVSSSEMEEEIMRQIMEEGLLDGIDLSNIDVTQEDELSERIANAYRQRQRERQQTRSARRSDSSPRPPVQLEPTPPRTTRHTRSRSTAFQVGDSNTRPLLSSQSNITTNASGTPEQAPVQLSGNQQTRRNLRRASIDIARAERPNPRPLSDETSQTRPPPSVAGGPRSTTDPAASGPSSRPQQTTDSRATGQARDTPLTQQATLRSEASTSREHQSPTLPWPTDNTPAGPIQRQSLYVEPEVSCDRCGRQHIEYDHHFNCSKCNNGSFNLCIDCYRSGQGCLHWYGFGRASRRSYEAKAPPGGYAADHSLPHTLHGRRLKKPGVPLVQNVTAGNANQLMSSEDPAKRLETGVFCEVCSRCANDCYWRCDICNEGEWGFCNPCVNQGRCCTHPLLPFAYMPTPPPTSSGKDAVPHPVTINLPPSAYLRRGPGPLEIGPLKSLVFNTICDVCRLHIPPSHTRFHCPICNNGDYNICTTSYNKLVNSGKIARKDGPLGWRRCLQGHRMIVVGFEDRDGGQHRRIDRDLVGGVALDESGGLAFEGRWYWPVDGGERKEKRLAASPTSPSAGQLSPSQNAQSSQYPPDGGTGRVAYARWSFFPDGSATDELMFPKYAEIREIQVVNDQWYWGVYAGAKGMLPAGRVALL